MASHSLSPRRIMSLDPRLPDCKGGQPGKTRVQPLAASREPRRKWEPAGWRDSKLLTVVAVDAPFCTRRDQQPRCVVYGEMISPVSGSTISMVDDASAPVRLEERVRWSRKDFMRSGTRTILSPHVQVYRTVPVWPRRRISSAIKMRSSVPIIIRTANAIIIGNRLPKRSWSRR